MGDNSSHADSSGESGHSNNNQESGEGSVSFFQESSEASNESSNWPFSSDSSIAWPVEGPTLDELPLWTTRARPLRVTVPPNPFSKPAAVREPPFFSSPKRCIVCWEKQTFTGFRPCRHASVCDTCAKKLDECPECRRPIDRKIKIIQLLD